MAEQAACDNGATATETVLEEETDGQNPADAPILRLKLKKPKSDKKVQFDSTTVDNENLGRKKSKCCCIYTKPVEFGESSSESEDECENCFGHVEHRHKGSSNDPGPSHDKFDPNCSGHSPK